MSKVKQVPRISVKVPLVEWEMLRKLGALEGRTRQSEFARMVRERCAEAGVQLTKHELRLLRRRANGRA